MATSKNAAKGPHKLIDWGKVNKKISGKKASVNVYSRVIESVSKAVGITTLDPVKLPSATVKKDKKGHSRLSNASITKSGAKYLLVSDGVLKKTKSGSHPVFHRLPLPPEISAAKALAVLSKSKVKLIKFPNGIEYKIGK